MSENRFPPGFVERMRRSLGNELPAFLEALAEPPAGLRVNTLRIEPDAFAAIAPFPVMRAAYPAEGFLLGGSERPGRHPHHAAGVYYLQDPGAMAIGALVDPKPGERVIDVSAAPGGKATHLAARMRNHGVLVANDVVRSRALELVGNIERCGIRNTIVTSVDVDRLVGRFGASFDRVLVDAPCSGESMFHKSGEARRAWSEAAVLGCARRQIDLVSASADLVAPGGILVYSTCTFAPEENEDVVAGLLDRRRDFAPAPLEEVPGAESIALVPSAEGAGAAAAYRLWPHRFPGAGHFVAALRRHGGERSQSFETSATATPVGRDRLRVFEEFAAAVLPGLSLDPGRLSLRGDTLLERVDGEPDLRGLAVLRAGLELGTFRPGRFEPSHALALASALSVVADVVNLNAADPRIGRYLEGNTIQAEGSAGWVLVAVDGFPLGWGKRVGGTVKNHYPKGLRRPGEHWPKGA